MKYADLTPEMERELVARYQAGDRAAGSLLQETHRGVVWGLIDSHVKRLKDPDAGDDAIQTAWLGFFEAANKVDMSSGNRLTTYAGLCAWGTMLRAHAENSTIRLSLHMLKKVRRLERSGEAMPDDVAEAARLLRLMSLDFPELTKDGQGVIEEPLVETIAGSEQSPESCLGSRQAAQRVQEVLTEALDSLGHRDRDIIRRSELVDEPETLADIARSYGVSREAIRQAHVKAMERLEKAVLRVAKEDDAILWGGEWRQPRRREMLEAA
ncbi:sigma-70 family RNA polymerase sigma factor [Sorangium sp. So ce118]